MLLLTSSMAMAQKLFLGSPNGRLEVMIEMNGGVATYTVYYDGFQVIQPSQLGFEADFGDFTKDLSFKEKIGADTLNLVPLGVSDQTVNLKYKKLKHSKYSTCKQFYKVPFKNSKGQEMSVVFFGEKQQHCFPLRDTPSRRESQVWRYPSRGVVVQIS